MTERKFSVENRIKNKLPSQENKEFMIRAGKPEDV
jgi:hypothetical protein